MLASNIEILNENLEKPPKLTCARIMGSDAHAIVEQLYFYFLARSTILAWRKRMESFRRRLQFVTLVIEEWQPRMGTNLLAHLRTTHSNLHLH